MKTRDKCSRHHDRPGATGAPQAVQGLPGPSIHWQRLTGGRGSERGCAGIWGGAHAVTSAAASFGTTTGGGGSLRNCPALPRALGWVEL